jgi:hypothetical protein
MCCGSYKKYKAWQKAPSPVKEELYFAAISKRIFLKIDSMISNNKRFQSNSEHLFMNWLCHNYIVRISMSIRRLFSRYGSTKLNFRNLLKEVEKKPEIICVDNLVKSRRHLLKKSPSSLWGYSKESLRQEASRLFAEVLKNNAVTSLNKKEVRCDLKETWKLTKPIIKYTDEKFAHMGNYSPQIQPIIMDANKCLELLIEKWNKYSRLLGAPTAFSIPDDNILFCDWQRLFSFPWINT